ncbi:hypothetical protein M885DRAFT_189123 [Pelagophyceae sp. CCMP2097]|nr:hypothetical protein M885DRAFT_189123 [Pelagophyceae sp. CCMP2097]
MAQCAEEPRGLYVRGLGSKCTEEALAQVFAAVCKVASITIPVDRPTGFTKGYAFIKLCQGYDADKVRGAVNGIVLDGRKLHVSLLDSRRAATCSRRDGCIAVNTALQRCSAANAILSVCTTSLSSMNQVNLSTALQRLGHAGDVDVDDLRFLKLTRACVNSVSQGKWEPRNLVSAAWALTRLCAFEKLPDLHHAVAEAMILQMAQFKPSHLALAVWSFSTSKIHRPDLFHAVADAALPVVVDFNAQDVANTLRAFAASQIHTPALFKALARRALTVASEFTAQHCENAVWAYATAGFEAVLLFEAVAPCALRQLAFFKPKELATTAWAYATAQVMHAKLFAAIAASATLRVRELNGQDIATLAWAFAKARIDSPRLFQALALSFVDLCKTRPLKPQDVSTCVWAFATAGMMHRGLFLCVARLSPPRMGEFNAQDLSNCAWAFAHAGIDDEVVDGGLGQTEERPDEFGIRRLFDSIAEAASFKACELSTQNLSNLAWSFATANIPAPRLFKAIEAETLGRLADCEPQSLARARAGTFGKRGEHGVGLCDGRLCRPRALPRRGVGGGQIGGDFQTAGADKRGLGLCDGGRRRSRTFRRHRSKRVSANRPKRARGAGAGESGVGLFCRLVCGTGPFSSRRQVVFKNLAVFFNGFFKRMRPFPSGLEEGASAGAGEEAPG